ncbi:transposase [Klebsiella pneumoniae]|nr:transposase [Klebsiella pneumoniae]
MKKTRYTEEQIAFALKQAETGICVGESAERWAFLKPFL